MLEKSLKQLVRAGPLQHFPDHRAIKGGPDVKAVWIEPIPQLIIEEIKEWADANGVECTRIPAYWLDGDGHDTPLGKLPSPGEKVLYSLHGGAYALHSAHPDNMTCGFPRGIMKYAPAVHRTLTLEYRLTKGPPSSPTHPFPAALLDAIAGYVYLVRTVGFDPSDVVVAGDSAGGNLALALVRYLVENKDHANLPSPPGALVLSSPWTDLGGSDHKEGGSVYTCRSTDFIDVVGPPLTSLNPLAANFIGLLGADAGASNRYISPASQAPTMRRVSFQGFPRTFVAYGGSEILKDQIRILCTKMRANMGDDGVEIAELSDAVHNFLVLPFFEPERTDTLRQISRWIMQ